MKLWLFRSRRERILAAILLVAVLSVSGAMITAILWRARTGKLTPIPVNLPGTGIQQEPPEEPPGMFTLDMSESRSLYPGVLRSMAVTLHNPFTFDVDITELWARVDATSSRACRVAGSNLQLRQFEGTALPLRIGAGGTQQPGVIPVYMPESVDQACAGVRFAISLHGTAVKAQAA